MEKKVLNKHIYRNTSSKEEISQQDSKAGYWASRFTELVLAGVAKWYGEETNVKATKRQSFPHNIPNGGKGNATCTHHPPNLITMKLWVV